MTSHPPLHPNLAQLLAARDEILERYHRGALDWPQARSQILSLVARDDQGVQWMLNPDDSAWYRKTRTNQLVRDVPPMFGVATPSAFDLSSGDPFRDPRRRITHEAIDPQNFAAPGSLVGATQRQPAPASAPQGPARTDDRVRIVIGVAVILVSLAALWMMWGPR